ncbi:hypothetical protein EV652_103624 [Kribbella steppae]|uniref:Uncharacterized protein n=1 Tax=Kribbella steppae TaxID=2512223 RepID=A0A4R2HR08_9ACTN|nr:hypothetical protein [Kribbella steppae]TCO33622.1 hypothetical protein EV652_103624 [Kribbella steppae]
MAEPEEIMVGNPQKSELASLRSTLANNREAIAGALDKAAAKMADGRTWTGPTKATNWKSEVDGRKKKLGPWVDTILEQIDEKLKNMPEQVTASQARAIHNEQRTRGY